MHPQLKGTVVFWPGEPWLRGARFFAAPFIRAMLAWGLRTCKDGVTFPLLGPQSWPSDRKASSQNCFLGLSGLHMRLSDSKTPWWGHVMSSW